MSKKPIGENGEKNIASESILGNSGQILGLSQKNKNMLMNLYVRFVGEKEGLLQDNIFSLEKISLYLQDSFLQYLKDHDITFFHVLEKQLGRPLTLQDVEFLKLQQDQLQEVQGEMLWGVQLAYIEKYRDILNKSQLQFSQKQKQEFEETVARMQTGRVTMQVFFHIVNQMIDQWSEGGLSYIQAEGLRNVGSVTSDDVAHVAKKYHLLEEDEIHTMSTTGKIGSYNFLQKSLSDISLQYSRTIQQAESRIIDQMEVDSKKFDTIRFASFVQDGNQEAVSIAKKIEDNKWDISTMSIEDQKIFFDFMKCEWKKSEAYIANKEQLIEQLCMVDEVQFETIVDALFNPEQKVLDIKLHDGDILHINIDKEVMSTKTFLGLGGLSKFKKGLPLKIEASFKDVADKNIAGSDKGEIFNLSNPKTLSNLIQKLGLITGYTQQSVIEDKENEEEYRKDVLMHNVSEAIDNAQKSSVLYNINKEDMDDDLWPDLGDDESTVLKELFENEKGREEHKPLPRFTYEQIVANAQLDDNTRVKQAIDLLDQYMGAGWFAKKSEQEQKTIKDAILEAHYSTVYKQGEAYPQDAIWSEEDQCWREQGMIAGRPASVYFYTKEQLRKKAEILKAAGLSRTHISVLFRSGISGEFDAEIEELNRQIDELKVQKEDFEIELQEAVRTFKDLYRNGKDGAESLHSLERKKDALDTRIEIVKQAWADAERRKSDMAYWGTLSPADQAAHEDRIVVLSQQHQDMVQQRKDFLEEIAETTESLQEEKQAITTLKEQIKDVNKKRDALLRQINTYESNPGSYFDRKNATEDERKEFYEREKKRWNDEIKKYEDLNKSLEEKRLNIMDINDPLYKQISVDKLANEEKIKAAKSQLEVLERTYRGVEKTEKEKKRKEERESLGESEGFEELKKVRDGIKGHTGVTLGDRNAPHPQIFLRNSEKHIGKYGGSFVRCEIVNVDKATGHITVKLFGVTGKLEQDNNGVVSPLEGREFEFNPQGFKKFLDNSMWDSKTKFPGMANNGYVSMKEWGEKLKADMLAGKYSLDADLSKWLEDFVARVDFASIKYQSPGSSAGGDHIKYMGRAQTTDVGNPDWTEQGDWYKVDFSKNGRVKISQPMYPDTKSFELSYDAFVLFCADKGLKPYSQGDVDKINEEGGQKKGLDYVDQGIAPGTQDSDVIRKNQKRGLFGWNWITPHAVMFQWKKIKEAYKKKIDSWTKNDEEKVGEVFANSWLAKKIGGAGIPLISEVIQRDFVGPAAVAADKKKKAKIDEYAKHPDDNKDTTPGGAFDFIKAALFDRPEKLARADLLQVAGYFQYCCTKGDLYPRSMAKYRGTGKWIQLLCGSDWQKAYLRWYEEQKQLLEKYPDDLDIRNKVIYGEAYFLSNVIGGKQFSGANLDTHFKNATGKTMKRGDVISEEFGKIYSKAWMGSVLDMAIAGGMGQAEKVKGKKEELLKSEKYNFTMLEGEIYGSFEGKSLTAGLGYLEPMAAKMGGSEGYYKNRSLAMLYPLLSGQLNYVTDIAVKAEYMGTARKYGFPLGLYAWHTPESGRQELIKLLTLFEKDAGYTGKSIATIVQELGDRTDEESLKTFTKALRGADGKGGWWGSVGSHVLKVMASPSDLFRIEDNLSTNEVSGQTIDSQLAKDYADTLQLYIDKKFTDGDISSSGSDAKLFAYSLKKNIWAMSPGFIAGNLWSFRNKIFEPRVVDNVPGLWKELTKELKKYRDKPSGDLTEREVSFLMNKFHAIVGQGARLQGSTEEEILYAMYAPKIIKFQPIAGKKGGGSPDAQEPFPADMLKKYIMKGVDGKSMEGNNLPGVVRENLETWIDVFQREDFKTKLPGLVTQGKIKMFVEQKDLQKDINAKEAITPLARQAEEYFKSPRRYGNKDRKWYNQQFGYAPETLYDDDDDDD